MTFHCSMIVDPAVAEHAFAHCRMRFFSTVNGRFSFFVADGSAHESEEEKTEAATVQKLHLPKKETGLK